MRYLGYAACILACLMIASPAVAGSFTNGGFESGDFTGWTQGGGYWYGGWPMDPNSYLPSGSNYSPTGNRSGIVTNYMDPYTDYNLRSVLTGTYSARVNDNINDDTVSVISQTVTNYTDPTIYFAWAAVLQGSHGLTDSDNFTLVLRDITKGFDLYNVSYSSASAAGTNLFTLSSWGWYYTQWQLQSLDVSHYMGDDFSLTLLGSDCPYGGHAGYVYLDGFGNIAPPIPEPATLAMLGGGITLAAAWLRRRL